MDLIVKTKNKREEKVVQAFLNSLEIDYFTEVQEEKALYKAMQEGRKTSILSPKERDSFIRLLKKAK